MSSLLDVLHRRSSRPGDAAAAAEVVPGAPESVEEAAAALDITAELELVAAPTGPYREPAVTASDETVDDSVPHRDGPAEATQALGTTTELRRWTDVAQPGAAPAAIAVAGSSPVARSRVGVVLVVLGLVAVAAALAAWRLLQPPQESFLAQPEPMPAPVADTAVVDTGNQAGPVASAPAPPPAAAPVERRPAIDTATEVAWYDQPALPAATPAPQAAPLIEITRGTTGQSPVFPRLRAAYDALLVGDGFRAEALYREVLGIEPANIDALLGLASLAARAGRTPEALDLYRSVQRLDPKNASAAAALSALPGGAVPASTESELKLMLREQPAAASLHFALGVRYVHEQRWPDAQAAFFEAVRHEPTNADFAFNLAVSLDRMGQARQAASYYERAIELASGAQQFDPVAARARLAVLRGGQG